MAPTPEQLKLETAILMLKHVLQATGPTAQKRANNMVGIAAKNKELRDIIEHVHNSVFNCLDELTTVELQHPPTTFKQGIAIDPSSSSPGVAVYPPLPPGQYNVSGDGIILDGSHAGRKVFGLSAEDIINRATQR